MAHPKLLAFMLTLSLPQDKANHTFYGNVAAFIAALTWPFFVMLGVHLGLTHFSRRLFVGAVVVTVAVGKEVIYDWLMKLGTPDPWDAAWTVIGGMPVWVLSGD